MSANHTKKHYYRQHKQHKAKQLPPKPQKPFLEWLNSWFWWLFFRLVFCYFIFMLGYIVGSPTGGM